MVHMSRLGAIVCLGSRLRENVPTIKWDVQAFPTCYSSIMESNESSGMDGALRLRRLEWEIQCLRQKVQTQKRLIRRMDVEASQRFEMLDEDNLEIREYFAESLE